VGSCHLTLMVIRIASQLSITMLFVLMMCSHNVCKAETSYSTASRVGPSFSCKAPNPIEAAICADQKLASRDRTMASLFAAARIDAFGTGISEEQSLQRKWLHDRNEQCAKESEPNCLIGAYDDRLFDLAVATLFTAHDEAMSELDRQNAKAAQLYEAIFQYSTIEDPNVRARKVGRLISGAFDATKDTFLVSADQLYRDIPDAGAAASSDKAFSAVIDVASVENYVQRPVPFVFPCAALIKRPGLMDVLNAIFGGALSTGDSHDLTAMQPCLPCPAWTSWSAQWRWHNPPVTEPSAFPHIESMTR
jgi:uncharacterized protein